MELKHTFERSIFICPKCRLVNNLTDNEFAQYFYSKDIMCKQPGCGKIDLWESIKTILGDLSHFGQHYNLLGCKGDYIEFLLKPNEIYDLDLRERIGKGKILNINYGSAAINEGQDFGGLGPLRLVSSHMEGVNDFIPNYIQFYPNSYADNTNETMAYINVWYATEEIIDDLPIMIILDAFKKYYEKSYRHMIISAQTSLEILTSSACENFMLSNGVSKNRTESFLQDNATFSPQLFTLIPLFANIMKIPPLNNKTIEGLTNLRKLRNRFVHDGQVEKDIDHNTARDIMISTLLAFKYLRLILPITAI